ncbi:MAG: heavy-metal-associated domain-containing protein [Methanothrix sp.]|jgi:copper chaperone CopZ|nr:heavy-metal-associated domain-containing protein [Methanothrix sp.]
MEEVQLKVLGMACAGCQAAVETALRSLDGVFSAEVDLEAKTARVSYDPAKLARTDLQEAIEKAGYKIG